MVPPPRGMAIGIVAWRGICVADRCQFAMEGPMAKWRTGRRRAAAAGLVCVMATSLAGCETMRDDQNRLAAATIAGVTAGAALGYWGIGGSGAVKWIAAGLTGAAGGALGYAAMDYYNTMRKSDRATMERSVFRGLNETGAGTEIRWKNEETGNGGGVTPRRTYLDDKGRICRTSTKRHVGRCGTWRQRHRLPKRRRQLGPDLERNAGGGTRPAAVEKRPCGTAQV